MRRSAYTGQSEATNFRTWTCVRACATYLRAWTGPSTSIANQEGGLQDLAKGHMLDLT